MGQSNIMCREAYIFLPKMFTLNLNMTNPNYETFFNTTGLGSSKISTGKGKENCSELKD